MTEITDKNPLIDSTTSQTLANCADVVDYMAYYTNNEGGYPNDNIICGGILIFRAVTDALRYESKRAGEQQRLRPEVVTEEKPDHDERKH